MTTDMHSMIRGLLLVLTILLEMETVRGSCSRKIDHCQKMKMRLGYQGPIKPNDPLIMVRRHDNVRLTHMCSSKGVLAKIIQCMDRTFKSEACKKDLIYSKVTKYFDGDRTTRGMDYFCNKYEVVQKADKCIKKPNDKLARCRRNQVAIVGERIQNGLVDNNMICTATIAKIDCVREHLESTCGARVVAILARTMALSMPQICDQYRVLDSTTDGARTLTIPTLVLVVLALTTYTIVVQ